VKWTQHSYEAMLTSKHGQDENVATLDAKVINITFTFQRYIYIYELLVHESIINNLPCTCFVISGVFPSCTSNLDFVSIIASCRQSYYITCKHMYHMYNVHRRWQTHHFTLSWNDVEDILKLDHLGLDWMLNLFVPFDWIIGNIIPNSWFGTFQWSLSHSWIFGFKFVLYFLIQE